MGRFDHCNAALTLSRWVQGYFREVTKEYVAALPTYVNPPGGFSILLMPPISRHYSSLDNCEPGLTLPAVLAAGILQRGDKGGCSRAAAYRFKSLGGSNLSDPPIRPSLQLP